MRADWVLDSLVHSLVCVDLEGRVTYVNGATKCLTNGPLIDLIGKSFAEVLPLTCVLNGRPLIELVVNCRQNSKPILVSLSSKSDSRFLASLSEITSVSNPVTASPPSVLPH